MSANFAFTTLLIILAISVRSKAEDDSFRPPLKLRSSISLAGYSYSLPTKVDQAWIQSLRENIDHTFDSAVIVDSGPWVRPHPIYRFRSENVDTEDTLGHGVLIVALKNDKLYVYDSFLDLISSASGIDLGTFIDMVDREQQKFLHNSNQPILNNTISNLMEPLGGLLFGFAVTLTGGNGEKVTAAFIAGATIIFIFRKGIDWLNRYTVRKQFQPFRKVISQILKGTHLNSKDHSLVIRDENMQYMGLFLDREFFLPSKIRTCSSLLMGE